MEITRNQIAAIMPRAGRNIDKYLSWMNKFASDYGIVTPLRWAHYLAQIAVESGELRYSEEIASGAAYDTGRLAQRLGNTPQKDGDGQKYKGRGLIQLTGRTNYKLYSAAIGYDFTKHPEQVAMPGNAVRSSMWFWKRNGLNELADKDLVDAITKRINGGYNAIDKRKEYLSKAKDALNIG